MKFDLRLELVRYAQQHGVKPAARRFGCTPKTVVRMIRRGEIDGTLFGRCWRVEHGSLDDYVRRSARRGRTHARQHSSQTL